MSFNKHMHPKTILLIPSQLVYYAMQKYCVKTLHISLCTKETPLWEKPQKSEPVDGIVALQKTFQKIPLKKHASLSAVFNHLLLNQCSILLLLSAPHAQLNKQTRMM